MTAHVITGKLSNLIIEAYSSMHTNLPTCTSIRIPTSIPARITYNDDKAEIYRN